MSRGNDKKVIDIKNHPLFNDLKRTVHCKISLIVNNNRVICHRTSIIDPIYLTK